MSAVRCAMAVIFLLPFARAAPAAAEERVGAASDGQPGIHRVGVPEAAAPNVGGTFAYGLTEAQGDARGLHQRFSLRLAGAAAVLPWLNVAPALDGRLDLHSHDSGTLLGARLATRAFTSWQNVGFGAELTGWVAGAEQLSTIVRSASLDARALVVVRFEHSFVAFNAGYRFDRSAAAGANAPLYSPSDRLALGLSDFDAVLLGVGGGVEVAGNELFAEASSDWLVGSGAPPFSESPLRLAAGARRALSDALSAALVLEGLLSGRPQGGPLAPLIPIEPRVSLFVGASYRFGATRRAAPATSTTPPPSAVAPKPPPPVVQSEPTVTALELTVVDDAGAPVPGARAHVSVGAYQRDVELDAAGHHREDQVPLGTAKIVVSAPGFPAGERSLELVASAPGELRIELKALPSPSQVRGIVRSFGGTGLIAKIRVEPLGNESTTGVDGRFEIDVPPGSHEVVIEANGYQPQRRKITVDPEGVVILNAELTKKK